MSIRAYVPVTSSGLAALVEGHRLPGPLAAHAVTAALRAAWPEGDDEQWEYAALMAAAARSAADRRPTDRPRRYVLAVDVAAVEGRDDPTDPTSVRVPDGVAEAELAAVLADAADGASDDDDLGWYAVQEIEQLR